MATAASFSSAKPGGITVPALLLLSFASVVLFLFLLLPSLSPSFSSSSTSTSTSTSSSCADNPLSSVRSFRVVHIAGTREDVSWLHSQLEINSLPDPPSTPKGWHSLMKGINPRTRQQQLDDLRRVLLFGLVRWKLQNL